jgi:hypothetical protein
MRILIVSPFFPPQQAVASLRAQSFAETWAASGATVTVLTTRKREDQVGMPRPAAGFGVEAVGYRMPAVLDRLREQERNGEAATAAPRWSPRRVLRAVRSRTGIFSGIRMPDATDAWVRPALDWARKQPPWDVVVSSSGPYTAHLVALALRREGFARRWAADFRDLWTGNHLARGLPPFSWREGALEHQCLHAADLVVTVSEPLAADLRARTTTPVEVVWNGWDERDLDALDARPAFEDDDDHVNLVYTGTIYPPHQDPAPLLDAIVRLRRETPKLASRIRLHVAGERSDAWREAARARKLETQVVLRGVLPREEALRLQRDADALVIVAWTDPEEGVLTGKLFEYLAAAPPIIVIGGCRDNPIAAMVECAGRGVVAADDVAAITTTLRTLVQSPAAVRTERDDAFIRQFTRQHQATRLLEMIQAGAGVAGSRAY